MDLVSDSTWIHYSFSGTTSLAARGQIQELLNEYVAKESFKEMAEKVHLLLVHCEWVTSIDLSNAYFHLTALLMGLSKSAKFFSRVIHCIKDFNCSSAWCHTTPVLGRWLNRANDQEAATCHMAVVVEVTRRLEFLLNDGIVFLG